MSAPKGTGMTGTIGFDLLRLDGYMAMQTEEVDGKLYVDAILTEPRVERCRCEEPDVVKHGKRVVCFRDHPIQRQETYIRITRQRYRCRACGTLLLERLPWIEEKKRMTTRFMEQLAEDGIRMKFSMGGEINGVKESLVRRIFKEEAARRLSHYSFELPRVLGMDEKVLGGHPRFVIGDVEKRVLLDILISRKQTNLVEYFRQWEHSDRMKVEVITQDMHWPYKTLNETYFKGATVVIDKFHVLRYADFAVSEVRKSIQSKVDNEERIKLKNQIKLLQARPERLGLGDEFRLKTLFKRHPAIEQAVLFKEWFYDIYLCETRAEAEKAYDSWRELLPKELEQPFRKVLSYMREKRWRRLIFNYFEHRYTNAYVEATNNLLDEISRGGRGYDLETLRAKALLKYGDVRSDGTVYDYISLTEEEKEEVYGTRFGHGVNLSTFENDLRAGAFW
jgi:transposase